MPGDAFDASPQELVVTLLGSYVHPRETRRVWSGGLVAALAELGFSDGAARIALTRVVRRGLLRGRRRARPPRGGAPRPPPPPPGGPPGPSPPAPPHHRAARRRRPPDLLPRPPRAPRRRVDGALAEHPGEPPPGAGTPGQTAEVPRVRALP